MFSSFLIPSLFEGVQARHLLVFYKQLGQFGADQVAFIGEPEYFRPPAALEAEGRPEWQPSWRDAYDYDPPASLDGVQTRALPADLLQSRLGRAKSSWKLYGQVVTRRLPELEAAVGGALDSIAASAPLEGVLLFANNASVTHAAAQRGLPVVHNEFGPLRKPAYVPTAYWDRRGVSRGSDAPHRYRAFCREASADAVPMLDRDEILHTLRRSPLPDLTDAASAPFGVGVALQGEENAHVHGLSALDLVSFARQRLSREQVLVRYHWGTLTRLSETLCVADDSPGATEFIVKCSAILTVNSGTVLEAALLGRRAVVLGDSPFALIGDRRLDGPPARPEKAQLRALNFLVFGYLVPGPLMFDPTYTRWRLSDPPELEIYRHHQRWYRAQLAATPAPANAALGLSVAGKLLQAVADGGPRRPFVVFGAGATTPALIVSLPPRRFSVLEVFDNDPARWGQRIGGVEVAPPRYRPDVDVIVSSLTHADAMAEQLRALGYPLHRILRLR